MLALSKSPSNTNSEFSGEMASSNYFKRGLAGDADVSIADGITF